MCSLTEADISADGYLMTPYPPKYAMFVLYTPQKDNTYRVVLQDNKLPIFKIPKDDRFVSTPITLLDDKTEGQFNILNVRDYAHYVLDLMFDQVSDLNHDYFRTDFSDDFLILDIPLQDDFIVHDGFCVKTYSDLNEPYEETLRTLPTPRD